MSLPGNVWIDIEVQAVSVLFKYLLSIILFIIVITTNNSNKIVLKK